MEFLFYLTWGTLLLSPIIAFILCWNLSKKENYNNKRFFLINLWFLSFTLILTWSPLSFTGNIADWVIICFTYFSYCYIVFSSLFLKQPLLKIITITLGSFIISIGYLLGTIGIIGLAFITGDYEIDHTKELKKNYYHVQYLQGNNNPPPN